MDIEYLKTAVGRHLARALREMATSRPERPIEFLAYHLISQHEKELELQKRKKSKYVSEVKEKDSSGTVQTESKGAEVSDSSAKASDSSTKASDSSPKPPDSKAKASDSPTKASDSSPKTPDSKAKALDSSTKARDSPAKVSDSKAKPSDSSTKTKDSSAKASDFDTDEVLSSLMSELVDKSVKSYDPTVSDSPTDGLSSEVVNDQLKTSLPPIVIGSNAHLDERIDELINDPDGHENRDFDATVDQDMPQVYEVVSKPSDGVDGQMDIQ